MSATPCRPVRGIPSSTHLLRLDKPASYTVNLEPSRDCVKERQTAPHRHAIPLNKSLFTSDSSRPPRHLPHRLRHPPPQPRPRNHLRRPPRRLRLPFRRQTPRLWPRHSRQTRPCPPSKPRPPLKTIATDNPGSTKTPSNSSSATNPMRTTTQTHKPKVTPCLRTGCGKISQASPAPGSARSSHPAACAATRRRVAPHRYRSISLG